MAPVLRSVKKIGIVRQKRTANPQKTAVSVKKTEAVAKAKRRSVHPKPKKSVKVPRSSG